MLEQSLRNRFSLVARRVSLGMLLSIGWLFTEGLFPPTRSSFLTKASSSGRDHTGNGPVIKICIFFSTSSDRRSPSAFTGRG